MIICVSQNGKGGMGRPQGTHYNVRWLVLGMRPYAKRVEGSHREAYRPAFDSNNTLLIAQPLQ
jgi:hypothetical protein